VTPPLRVALLGCGALAEVLSERVYPRLRHVVAVAATVDVREERAQSLGRALDAPAFTSLAEAAASVPFDAVDIRLPHHLHLAGAREAGELGLPFLVEKPMAATLADAREIGEIAERVSGPCGVAENYGFLAPVRAARELVRAGAIGDLLVCQSTRVFDLGDEWRRDGWRFAADGAPGVLVDQAPHVARLLRTVVGELAEVQAYLRGSPAHSATVSCRFEAGQIGTQLYCWSCPTPAAPEDTAELSLYGSAGSIEIYVRYSGKGGGSLLRRPGSPDEWHGGATNYYDSLAAALEDWALAVLERRRPECSIDEGIADMRVLEAIRVAAGDGGPVHLGGTIN
jgi:predicted dehydrogenase